MTSPELRDRRRPRPRTRPERAAPTGRDRRGQIGLAAACVPDLGRLRTRPRASSSWCRADAESPRRPAAARCAAAGVGADHGDALQRLRGQAAGCRRWSAARWPRRGAAGADASSPRVGGDGSYRRDGCIERTDPIQRAQRRVPAASRSALSTRPSSTAASTSAPQRPAGPRHLQVRARRPATSWSSTARTSRS